MSSLSIPSLKRRARSTSFNHKPTNSSSTIQIPFLHRKGSFQVTSSSTPTVQRISQQQEEDVYPPRRQRQSEKRDVYGFLIESQWIDIPTFESFQTYYEPILKRRAAKWHQLLDENQGQFPSRSNKVKRFIRKGIPRELRGKAWFHYSGASQNRKPGVYIEYLNKATSMGHENEHLDIIERDLHRTFPENDKFKDPSMIQSLRNVLLSFSLYTPSIGYCQSLNYIVGMLLLFMETEEEVFWMLVTLIHDILPKNVYDVTMEGANLDQDVLMQLVSERYPGLWLKVAGEGFWECEQRGCMPTCSLITSHWFLTLYINILPIETVLRVWDCLFYDGQKVLFRIALAIFKLNEHELSTVMTCYIRDGDAEFFYKKNMPKKMVDCHQLIDATYSQYASTTRLTDEEIIDRRELFRKRRDERRRNVPVQKFQRNRLKKSSVRGTVIHKAKEARWLVERAKSVKR
ncbi:TBC-domain-containing protein [Backusella circina FSU 941]|nr:TBC-domain-containing protein [Backusella circina FSU 941]